MNRMGKLKNHFASSLLMKGLAATTGMVGAFSLLGLGVFLLIQDRAVNRQLALRGESMAQSLARELQFSLLVGDRERRAACWRATPTKTCCSWRF